MRPIQAGDLVMVVRPTPCCGNGTYIGSVYKVAYMRRNCAMHCNYCRKQAVTSFALDGNYDGHAVEELIRIDPPALPESVDTNREVVA